MKIHIFKYFLKGNKTVILLANKACMKRAYIIGNTEEKAGTGSKESSSLCVDRHRLCVWRDKHLVGILAFWEE